MDHFSIRIRRTFQLVSTLKIVSKFSVYANIGINIIRFSSISERKIKYMFSGENRAERRQFSPALQAGIGLRYGF